MDVCMGCCGKCSGEGSVEPGMMSTSMELHMSCSRSSSCSMGEALKVEAS